MSNPMNAPVGQQLLDTPFADMIRSMGLAIAEAQFALDEVGIRLAQMMSGRYEIEEEDPANPGETITVEKTSLVRFDGQDLSLLELGFTPSFYQFVDTVIEIKISISMTRQNEYQRSRKTRSMRAAGGLFLGMGGITARSSSVNASYASKYQYSAEGASLMRTKLVSIPAPAILEERIRAIVEREAEA